MGAYKYIKQTFQKEYKERNQVLRDKIVNWRKEGTVVRVDSPSNIARARELGYRAKLGVIVARVKVKKGLTKRARPAGGRKPSKYGRFYAFRKSTQAIAEDRASGKFTNCEVLNSYYAGEDGMFKFFEVILLDRTNPNITSDPTYSKVVLNKGRSYRGITSTGKKHRGLLHKGFGTNKSRPSVRAHLRDIR